MAKRSKEPESPESEAGVVTVEEPVSDPPPVETKPALPPPPREPPAPPRTATGPSFGDRVGRFFRFLFRLVVLLLFLGLLSLVLYLTLPWLYQRFIRPVEQNTVQVQELQSRQEQTEQKLADLQTQLGTLQDVQNTHDGSLTDLDERMSKIESEIAARTESLAALESLQSELKAQNQQVSAELERQIGLLKAMELLSRARLSMYQSNFGLARQDVQIAHDLLATVRPDAPEPLAGELDAVILRLDLTLSNLPDFPVAAADDLDIAWQILLSGLPQATPTLVATAMQTATPTFVGTLPSTPTGVGTSTPTLVATLPPTSTP